MCYAIPGKIKEIKDNLVIIDYFGEERDALNEFDLKIGDYVYAQAGAVIQKIETEKAVKIAKELELDLVEVNPKPNPPICKIMDYGQFKYESEKKAHKQRMQQKKVDTKEVRLSVRISKHDFEFRLECDQEAEWFFDRDLIAGIINSTINNSIRYTHSKIILSAEINNNYLQISIEDDGSGFPEQMFSRPDTLETAIDMKSGSTGLGLYFAEQIANIAYFALVMGVGIKFVRFIKSQK